MFVMVQIQILLFMCKFSILYLMEFRRRGKSLEKKWRRKWKEKREFWWIYFSSKYNTTLISSIYFHAIIISKNLGIFASFSNKIISSNKAKYFYLFLSLSLPHKLYSLNSCLKLFRLFRRKRREPTK